MSPLWYILGYIIDFNEIYLTSQQIVKCVEFISSFMKNGVVMVIHSRCFPSLPERPRSCDYSLAFAETVSTVREISVIRLVMGKPRSCQDKIC